MSSAKETDRRWVSAGDTVRSESSRPGVEGPVLMGVYTSILLCLGMFVRPGGEWGDRYRLRGGGEKANVSSGGKPHDAQERASKLSRCQDVNSGYQYDS